MRAEIKIRHASQKARSFEVRPLYICMLISRVRLQKAMSGGKERGAARVDAKSTTAKWPVTINVYRTQHSQPKRSLNQEHC